MGNYLQMATQQQIQALLELGWSHCRIARELGVHRETVSRYARGRGARPDANPIGMATGGLPEITMPVQNRPNPITGPPSAVLPYQAFIEERLRKGLSAQRIWQDLVEEHRYQRGYLTVQRYVHRLKRARPEVADRWSIPPVRKPRSTSSRARRWCSMSRVAGADRGYSG